VPRSDPALSPNQGSAAGNKQDRAGVTHPPWTSFAGGPSRL